MDTSERRQNLKEALVGAAERAIAAHGLAGLKARALAAEAGCAVGAIYNVFADLDDLALAVNGRTLAGLKDALDAAAGRGKPARSSRDAVRDLVAMATAYLDFAAANTGRWRALFEHRLPAGKALPDWYLADQATLFAHVEQPLALLKPGMKASECSLLARSLFSAVHGLVSLGLEEKLGVVPPAALRAQVELVVTAMGRGLAKSGG